MSKKQILIIIATIILLIAIPVTFFLARKQQTVKSRANFTTQVDFLDQNGNVINQTNQPRVKLRIRLEVPPPVSPSPSPSGGGNQSI